MSSALGATSKAQVIVSNPYEHQKYRALPYSHDQISKLEGKLQTLNKQIQELVSQTEPELLPIEQTPKSDVKAPSDQQSLEIQDKLENL